MPDIWTHIIAGQEIAAKLNNPFWQQQIEKYKNIFRLGCQGPDFFYYYNFWPWSKDNKNGSFYGNTIHKEKCGQFYQEIIKYIPKIDNPIERNIAMVYLIGLITHWTVDRTTHPYIHYIAGIEKHNVPVGNHKLIEASIDTILTYKKLHLNIKRTSPQSYIDVGEHLPEIIIDIYLNVLTKLYLVNAPSLPTSELIDKSYQDMIKAVKLFHDPYHLKQISFKIFDFFTKKKFNASVYIYRDISELKNDYLNENNHQWCHPCEKAECYNYSFWNLLDTACSDACNLISLTIDYLNYGDYRHPIEDSFPNISFDTGKSTKDKRPLQYSQPILY